MVFITLLASGAVAGKYDDIDLSPYEDALNAMKTLEARFVQKSPNGKKTHGTIYMKRPGKMRIVYDSNKMELVADGENFVFKDLVLNETSVVPLDKTPAHVFLKGNINFRKDALLTGVGQSRDEISITLRNKKGQNNGAIVLFFNKKNRKLTSWTIIDTKNKQTSVRLMKTKLNVSVNNALFKVSMPKK